MQFLRGVSVVAGLLLICGAALEGQEAPAPKPPESSRQAAAATPVPVPSALNKVGAAVCTNATPLCVEVPFVIVKVASNAPASA